MVDSHRQATSSSPSLTMTVRETGEIRGSLLTIVTVTLSQSFGFRFLTPRAEDERALFDEYAKLTSDSRRNQTSSSSG
jgi:hypothetical protein